MVNKLIGSIPLLVIWVLPAFSQSLIPKEAIFRGKFIGRDLKIEGVLEGTVATDFSAEVTEDGVLKGRLETTDATIAGIVEGTILAIGLLTCTETAEVRGTIQCRDLEVSTGAIIRAQVSMGEEKTIGGPAKEKKKEVVPTRRERRRRRR